jgi:hypothetical protein
MMSDVVLRSQDVEVVSTLLTAVCRLHIEQVIKDLQHSLHMRFSMRHHTHEAVCGSGGHCSFQGSFPRFAIGQPWKGSNHPHTLKHETREDVVCLPCTLLYITKVQLQPERMHRPSSSPRILSSLLCTFHRFCTHFLFASAGKSFRRLAGH